MLRKSTNYNCCPCNSKHHFYSKSHTWLIMLLHVKLIPKSEPLGIAGAVLLGVALHVIPPTVSNH